MILQSFTIPNAAALLAMAAVFTILSVVYYYALGNVFLGSGWQRLPIAVAASLLGVLGMFRMGGVRENGEAGGWLQVLLLPYEALGLTLLLLPLVLLVAAAWRRWRSHHERRGEHMRDGRWGKGDETEKRTRSAKLRVHADE